MAKNKIYEMALKIGGKVDPSLAKACFAAKADINKLEKSIKDTSKAIGKGALVAGAAVIGAGALAVNNAKGYQSQMAGVSTLLTGAEAEVAQRTAQMSAEILEVSNATGVLADNLSAGMYEVVSAFGDSEESTARLKIAAKAAAAGNAETSDSVKLLSAVTKGYGDISAEAVQKAADLAFETARLGQTTFPELAHSMGAIIPLASTLGIAQEEVFGQMATLTGVTGSTSEVTTQLKATYQGFLNPTKQMAKAIKMAGFESGKAMLEAEGFQGSLEILKKSVGGNELAFAKLFSSVEAQTAVLAMGGNQAKDLTDKTQAMYKAAGAADKAFAKQTDTFEYDCQMIKNLGHNFTIEVGTKMLPHLRELAQFVLPYLSKGLATASDFIGNSVIPNVKIAFEWTAKNKDIILAVGGGVLAMVGAYKAYHATMLVVNAVQGIYNVIIGMSATGTFTMAAAATALNLPLLATVAIIGLIVAGAILVWKNWEKIKAFGVDCWETLKETMAPIGNLLCGIWDLGTRAFQDFINLVIKGLNLIPGIDIPLLNFAGGTETGGSVPAMAKGGIVSSPTLAMIGEGSESEAVIPLSKLRSMLGTFGGGGVSFAPVFHFHGSVTKAEAEEAGRASFEEFRRMYKRMKDEEDRKGF